MARGSQRGRNNNNPEGRNQYSGGLMERVRNHPIASAAAAGGAVAAGMFLWSKRDRIGDQVSTMSDKVGEWNSNRKSGTTGSNSAMSMSSGKRSSETGSESIGSGAIAGASAASTNSSGRATGGRGGKATTGQTMSPSRTASETVSY